MVGRATLVSGHLFVLIRLMDQISHTLVALSLAQSGLKHRTRFGTVALVVGANFPDIDMVAHVFDKALLVHRGVTHALPLLWVWPLLLTALFWAIAKFRPAGPGPPLRVGGLLLLFALSVASHPLLDYLNNYGVRWMAPFDDTWVYGDSLFIVDPWLYLILVLGIRRSFLAERRGRPRPGGPARMGLSVAAIYVGAMIVSTMLGRRLVRNHLGDDGVQARYMVSAVPIDPFRKKVVVDFGNRYRVGEINLLANPGVRLSVMVFKGDRLGAALDRARGTPRGRGFSQWTRFPAATVVGDSGLTRIVDLRYADAGQKSWASVDVVVPELSPTARDSVERPGQPIGRFPK